MSWACDMDNPSEFYSESRHRSRKERRCCETGMPIAIGEHYWSCRGKWDGDMSAFVQSESGYHLCRFINIELFGHCELCFEGLQDFIHEMRGDEPEHVAVRIYDLVKSGTLTLTSDEQAKSVAMGLGWRPMAEGTVRA